MMKEMEKNNQDSTGHWRTKAACATSDPELFFPVGNTGPALDQIDKAKEVCARCSVTEMCLQYALESHEDSGVWGGLSEDERRALKRRATAARRASDLVIKNAMNDRSSTSDIIDNPVVPNPYLR